MLARDHIEDPVPAAASVALTIPSIGLATEVQTMDAAACPVLNPPTIEIAYWVECRSAPGTDSDGTTFIIGHTMPAGSGVFSNLHSITPGTDVVVETRPGPSPIESSGPRTTTSTARLSGPPTCVSGSPAG